MSDSYTDAETELPLENERIEESEDQEEQDALDDSVLTGQAIPIVISLTDINGMGTLGGNVGAQINGNIILDGATTSPQSLTIAFSPATRATPIGTLPTSIGSGVRVIPFAFRLAGTAPSVPVQLTIIATTTTTGNPPAIKVQVMTVTAAPTYALLATAAPTLLPEDGDGE